jgi:glycine cleavage system H protein
MRFPDDIGLALNHTWARKGRDGIVTIGMNSLVAGLVGVMDSITLPARGSRVAPSAGGVMFHHSDCTLHLTPPFRGVVLDVNEEVLARPHLVVDDPYGKGWLFRLQVERSQDRFLLRGKKAAEWLREQAAGMRDFLNARVATHVAATMLDGGLPAEGRLKSFSPYVWKEFEETYLAHPGREG